MVTDVEWRLLGEIDRQGAEVAKGSREEPSSQLDKLAYAVIGAAIEVHRHLGSGFLETAYERALYIELQLRGIEFERQVPISLLYKEHDIGECYLDLVVEGMLVLELKAVAALHPIHTAQLLSYLKAGAFQVGLLINFNVNVLRDGIRRVIWNL